MLVERVGFEALVHVTCFESTWEELKSQAGGNLKWETIGRKLSCGGGGPTSHMSATPNSPLAFRLLFI